MKVNARGLFFLAVSLLLVPCAILHAQQWVPGQTVMVHDGDNVPVKQCEESEESQECCPTGGDAPGLSSPGSASCSLDCAWITINTGNMRPGALLPPGFFDLMVQEPSPEIFTPVRLHYVLGYNIRGISKEKTAAGVPREIVAVNNRGLTIAFRFNDGESIGIPYVGGQAEFDHRLMMVDAEGWATDEDPAYYDLYPGDGTVYRFNAASHVPDYLDLVQYKDKTGRTETPETLDTRIVRDEMRTIRQVLAPTVLADVVVTSPSEYRIDFYRRSDVQEEPDQDGLYVLNPGVTSPLRSTVIRNPDPEQSQNRLQVIQAADGQEEMCGDFTYNPESDAWTLDKGDGLVRQTAENAWSDNRQIMVETKYTHGPGNTRLNETRTRFEYINGAYLITEKISDPDGHARTTTYTRHTAAASGMKRGKIITALNSDGSWRRYQHNDNGFITAEITPWLDSPFSTSENPDLHRATYTTYTPVDPSDNPVYNDQRPRTVTRQVLGQTVQKTYHAYITGAHNELTEITEYAITPDAPYGDPDNLRTIRAYYGTNTTHAMNGRLKTVQHPDGRLETYTYEHGTFATNTIPALSSFTPDSSGHAWRETLTHGTAEHPDGIPGQTTRQIRILDPYARNVFNETHVKTSSGYERIAWVQNEFNDFTRITATHRSDGTLETQDWGASCGCVEATMSADGITHTYGYDALGRRTYQLRHGLHEDDPDIMEVYTYDAAGNRLTTTQYGGINTPETIVLQTSSNTYDNAGHLITSTDAQGITTTYSHGCCGLESITIRAGVTNLTVRYPDGRTHYTEQNGTRQQTYLYGLDGTTGHQTTTVYTGPQGTDSPAWQKTVTDMLGRTIRTERPGFGDTTLITEYTYNAKGQLISQSTVAGLQTTVSLYAYDALGQQVLTAQDLNLNGVIDLAGPDRVTSNATAFVQIDGDWYRESRSYIFPEASSATPLLTGLQRQRLTGLGGETDHGLLIAESISIDIHDNQTTQQTHIDRENAVRVALVATPSAENPSVQTTVNGLLISQTSPTGVTTTYEYDALARRIRSESLSDGGARTVASIIGYNAKGQVAFTEDGATNRTTYVYDSATGQRIAVTDALTNTTHSAYSLEGQLIATWGSTYPVAYEYDDFGRMTAMLTYRGTNEITDAASIFSLPTDRTTWLYDDATGVLTNKLYADGHGPSYTYTPDGKLATRTWARGITTTYTYDAASQLTNVVYSVDTPAITYTYDRLGRQKTASQSGTGVPPVIHEFAYDALTLALTNETIIANGATNILTRTQDALGRPVGAGLRTAPSQSPHYTVTYAYDPATGRFSGLQSTVPGLQTNDFAYTYLPGSDLIESLTKSGTGTSPVIATRTYEPTRNLITAIATSAGDPAVVLSRFDYTNDEIGRRTARIDNTAITNTFGYNIRSEVIEALMGTNTYGYAYDPIGNRLSASNNTESLTYLANELNQYTSISNAVTVEPTYDLDGNMLTHGAWTFTWNGENRLVVASNSTSQIVIENAYDYQGRRISKVVNGVTNTFVYDGWAMIREQSPTVTNHYVYGLDLSSSMQGAGTIGGILMADFNGTAAFYAYDANGNVTDLVDTNGAIVAHYEYDPFGNTIAQSGALAAANPFRFSTKYLDEDVKLYYYGYRHYMPELGRFVSVDPLKDLAFLVLYYKHENSTALRAFEVAKPQRKGAIVLRFLLRRRKELMEQSRGSAYGFVSNDPGGSYDMLGLFRYGNWCGPGWTGGKEEDSGEFDWINEWPYIVSIDDLDECCFRHDACFAGYDWHPGVDPDDLPWLDPDIQQCDADLCECAKNASSGGASRTAIIVTFCCIKPHDPGWPWN